MILSLHFFSSCETQKNGLVLLYDMTGSGYHNFDYSLARKVLELLKVAKIYLQNLVLDICHFDCIKKCNNEPKNVSLCDEISKFLQFSTSLYCLL